MQDAEYSHSDSLFPIANIESMITVYKVTVYIPSVTRLVGTRCGYEYDRALLWPVGNVVFYRSHDIIYSLATAAASDLISTATLKKSGGTQKTKIQKFRNCVPAHFKHCSSVKCVAVVKSVCDKSMYNFLKIGFH